MPKLPGWLLRWDAAHAASFEHTRYDPQRGAVLDRSAGRAVSVGYVTGPAQRASWTAAVPSWQADAPAGTALEIMLRAEIDGRWTGWYTLGLWSSAPERRHSVAGQRDADARVATDTLLLNRPSSAIQWRVGLHGTGDTTPALRGIAVALGPVAEAASPERLPVVAPLPVPALSQMIYPGGGPVWCSPTSLTMLLAYWFAQTGAPQLAPFADPQSVPELVAPAVYDAVYDGTGNWPFNTAYAATLGLSSYVLQLSSTGELAAWLAAGVPLVASIAWQTGELLDAPVGHSDGHLVVVVGLDQQGDVIVNDPAADPRQGQSVRRTYPQAQFRRAWNSSGRTVYLVGPAAVIDQTS